MMAERNLLNSIHTFIFDILAFFSNCQTNLITEYCRETANVCRERFFDFSRILFSGIRFNDLFMMKIHIFYQYSSMILRREIDLVNDQQLVKLFVLK
jgi:hypothetical protein